jgi:hypothetical protein
MSGKGFQVSRDPGARGRVESGNGHYDRMSRIFHNNQRNLPVTKGVRGVTFRIVNFPKSDDFGGSKNAFFGNN